MEMWMLPSPNTLPTTATTRALYEPKTLISTKLQDAFNNFSDSNDENNHFHDALLGPTSNISTWRLILTSFLCWIVTSCAVAAGIGGGGLLVPLYVLVLGLSSTKLAIPLSAATILGVAFGNSLYLVSKHHPQVHWGKGQQQSQFYTRPLIDYDTVILMQPGELMGVVVGVLFHQWFPEVLIVILLVLVLGFTAYKTLQKGHARWQAESRTISSLLSMSMHSDANACPETVRDEEHHGLMHTTNSDALDNDEWFLNTVNKESLESLKSQKSSLDEYSTAESTDNDEPQAPFLDEFDAEFSTTLHKIMQKEANQFPLDIYGVLLCMTAFLILYSLIVNNIIVTGLSNCSPEIYWPVYLSPLLIYGIVLVCFAQRNTRQYTKKVELSYPFLEGDVEWTWSNIRLLAPAAVGAGVLGGMLGIGGGMVLGPLFVALNFEVSAVPIVHAFTLMNQVHELNEPRQPQVGTASTGFMILFTAFSSTVQYMSNGSLSWQFALWFGSVGAIGGQTGQRVVKELVDRTGRPSIVVCLLGAIIGLAVVIMAISGSIHILEDAEAGADIWAFHAGLFLCQEK